MNLQQQVVPLKVKKQRVWEPMRELKEAGFGQVLRALKGQVTEQAEPQETTMPPVFKEQRQSSSCPLSSTLATVKK